MVSVSLPPSDCNTAIIWARSASCASSTASRRRSAVSGTSAFMSVLLVLGVRRWSLVALRELVPPIALNHQGPKVEIRGWGLELVFQDRYRWGLHGLAAVGEPCHWGTRGGNRRSGR